MKKPTVIDYEPILKDAFERWDHGYKFGVGDPFNTDGSNLYLMRNHILYYKGKIEETCTPEKYPEIYFKEIPPEVEQDYMARPDEIREHAKQTLAIYENDSDYKYLLRIIGSLDRHTVNSSCIEYVIGYVTGLKMAIEEDELVDMRRHEDPDNYLSRITNCAQEIKNSKPVLGDQISLFEILHI